MTDAQNLHRTACLYAWSSAYKYFIFHSSIKLFPTIVQELLSLLSQVDGMHKWQLATERSTTVD